MSDLQSQLNKKLWNASIKGNLEEVKKSLKEGANINVSQKKTIFDYFLFNQLLFF